MARFVIPTCDRPQLLRRSLGSVLRALSPESAIDHVMVIDDSRGEAARTANREVVVGLGRSAAVPVTYLGRPERAELAASLRGTMQTAIPEAVLRHAVLGWDHDHVPRGSGASRNTALLMAAGEALVSLDDDARFEFVALSDTLRNQGKPLETVEARDAGERFQQGTVDSLRRINRLTEPVEQDVLARMLDALKPASANGVKPVRAVMTGIAGNRWYQRIDHNFHSRGAPRELMLRSRRRYRRGITTGYSLMQVRSPMVTDSPFLVTCCHGLDAGTLLPPFPPNVRADDTVFMHLLQRHDPGHRIAHLPVMVCHDLGPRRPDPWRDPHSQYPTLDALATAMLTDVIRRAVPQPGAAGLRVLGRYLKDCAALPDDDWQAWALALWAQTLGAVAIAQKQSLARFNERPDFWAADVRRFHDRLASASPELPASLVGDLDALRGYLDGMGDVLFWWPEIWEAALQLRQEPRP